jgi:hypothetical protein
MHCFGSVAVVLLLLLLLPEMTLAGPQGVVKQSLFD